MEEDLENPFTTSAAASPDPLTITSAATSLEFSDDIDSCCSTPYVSAPSSPGRGTPLGGFYFSAPASPMHFVLSSNSISSYGVESSTAACSFEFDFSAPLADNGAPPGSMTSADELFLNGQIRPMKLSSHLRRPQVLAPLIDVDESDEIEQSERDDSSFSEEKFVRGRESKLRTGSLRRRTRSMSPLRTTSFLDQENDHAQHDDEMERENEVCKNTENPAGSNDTTTCESGSSSRSSSIGRSSRRWVFLKEFLYRSKSEGRNNGHKFWGSLSFSPVKDKKMEKPIPNPQNPSTEKPKDAANSTPEVVNFNTGATKKAPKEVKNRAVNGIGKRRVPPSPHELLYTANRAQAEEMKKKTFLPYRQGLLGCLGFSSKGYGAMNGFARALNSVSSR
ncbi:uncharacterized protein LOC111390180 [Olea europaea var. sylvestris]|uniref:Uncharacterized protein n=1 Tax=Olea europaea subsp. europaea TaxID=158383 RepID=A0A8S0TNZ1_OLEEU|nr:uncharacterized protein LOC111390180 [Olea europaea var. sylvestris]CAA3007011.1 Hypothetical predicted protein [Olea europaea subsp. europaea]